MIPARLDRAMDGGRLTGLGPSPYRYCEGARLRGEGAAAYWEDIS